jgi:hypothetical protein
MDQKVFLDQVDLMVLVVVDLVHGQESYVVQCLLEWGIQQVHLLEQFEVFVLQNEQQSLILKRCLFL